MSLFLARFLCGLGFHRAWPDIDPATSLTWVCCTCHQTQVGGAAAPRGKRNS